MLCSQKGLCKSLLTAPGRCRVTPFHYGILLGASLIVMLVAAAVLSVPLLVDRYERSHLDPDIELWP